MRVTIEYLCPHGLATWHWIGLPHRSATCTWGHREIRFL